MQINMLDAKNRLSALVAAAERGEEVILAKNGTPVAQIVPYHAPKIREPGAWRGQVAYSAEWRLPATEAQVAELLSGGDDAAP